MAATEGTTCEGIDLRDVFQHRCKSPFAKIRGYETGADHGRGHSGLCF